MLRQRVSLRDIVDVEAFVIMCIKRSGAPVRPPEYEDLVAEGIVILYAMEQKYIPKMDGYEKEGRFSGYAVKWMPRKMKEAWRRSREDVQSTTVDGKRRLRFYAHAVSYDALTATEDNEGHYDEGRLLLPGYFNDVPEAE